MIDKTYQPSEVEGRIYRTWEQAGAFKAGRPERAGAPAYSIVIPPPNVTGSLHMGHALNNTLQDILCRFERMRGKDVLWQPGTDHAGIATQMVVERQLMERQQPGRREMGREAFLKRVWEWKAESRAAPSSISSSGSAHPATGRASASPWTRGCRARCSKFSSSFTAKASSTRTSGWSTGTRSCSPRSPISKWCRSRPRATCGTCAIRSKARHSIPNDPSTYIVVATTRPETMLGDTAVAVHPDDERYKALVGKNVILPLVGRKIPIIADEYSDPEKGSGAVKITPAHDFNDFEVGKRHGLPQVNMLDDGGKDHLRRLRHFNAQSGAEFAARTKTLAEARSRRRSAQGRSSRVWKKKVWSKRSSRIPMPCRMATARTW